MYTYTEKQVQDLLSSILFGCTLTSAMGEEVSVHDVTIEREGDTSLQVFIHSDGEKHPYCGIPLERFPQQQNWYMHEVLRTYVGKDTSRDKLTLSALGLAGESGEVADTVKKLLYQGHRLDLMHLIEELGDVLWYLVLACNALECTLDDVMQANVTKLHARYPDGFDPQRSINR